VMGGWGTGRIGAGVEIPADLGVEPEEALFGESGGFLLEVPGSAAPDVLKVCETFGARARVLGETICEHQLVVSRAGKSLLDLTGERMSEVYFGSLETRAR
jgi:hypothetical protein